MHQNKSRDRDLPGREVHPKDNPKLIYSMYNLKLNIKDVIPWVDAARRCNDKYVRDPNALIGNGRAANNEVLESLDEGQIASKVWLIEQLNEVIIKVNLDNTKKKTKKIPVNPNVLVCGGWCGVMATLLFNSNIKINNVRSIDIDPGCKPIALTMNKHYKLNGKFTAGTCNMLDFKNYNDYDMIINTVCEHMSWDDYYKWLDKIPKDRLIILQSCNLKEYSTHISCVSSEEDFKKKCGVTNILYSGTLEVPKYFGEKSSFERYMVIGNRNG